MAGRGQVLLLAASSYATLALGFITGPLIARSLGPAGRGEVASIQVYAGLAATLLAFGTSAAVIHAARQPSQSEGQILGAVFRYALWLVPASVGAAVVVSQFVLVDLPPSLETWCWIFVAAAPLSVVGLTLTSLLLARGALSWVALVRGGPMLVTAIAVIALAITGALTTSTYLALAFGSSVLGLGVAAVAVRLRPRRGGRLGPLLRFGGRAWIGSLANIANFQLDQALIAPFLGVRELGYYAIAVTLSTIPIGLATSIGARIYGDVSVGSDDGLDLGRTGLYARLTLACAGLAAVLLAIIVPLGLPLLYGEAFRASVVPLLILLPGTIAVSGASVLEAALVLAGRPGANTKAELTALVVTAVGLLALLPAIGISGAAITTTVAYTSRFAVQVSVLRRMGPLDWRPRGGDVARVSQEVLQLPGRLMAARDSRGER